MNDFNNLNITSFELFGIVPYGQLRLNVSTKYKNDVLKIPEKGVSMRMYIYVKM